MQQLHISNVHFSFPGQDRPLFSDFSLTCAAGWTGIVGGNGTGKTTLLRLVTGDLSPDRGSILLPESTLLCEQRTDSPPHGLAELCSVPDGDAGRIVSILEIQGDWPYRWTTLSQGERKRAQVADALWRNPAVLLLDEPTNHLDRPSRRLISEALSRFPGVGVLVSHDRDLLDHLCHHCLFLDLFEEPTLRPGGFSRGMELVEAQREETERVYQKRYREKEAIEREADRRLRVAAKQDARRSKRNLDRNDSDGRAKIDLARVSGADGKAGRLSSQLEGRVSKANRRLSEIARPVRRRTGISVEGTVARSDLLFIREAGSFVLTNGVTVTHPELAIRPTDRIGIVGPNGSGKTTFLSQIVTEISRPERLVHIHQELTPEETRGLIDTFNALSNDERGIVLSTFARLGSEPTALLGTQMPSPGETRKLALAIGLLRKPSLIVMDEPTNHMDLVSIMGLEEALKSYNGALLLVSHDYRFLRELVDIRWEFTNGGGWEIRIED